MGDSMPPAEDAGLQDWLDWLEQLHPSTIDMGLDRVRRVAERLPLRMDCVVITVAGTNGKGSTCALLESILLAAGYRVGLYTSPHLLRFNERARIDGVELTDERFVEHFRAVDAARAGISLTYFEFTTLAALRAFALAGLDVAVLEVGLGGRLDAVNLVDADCAVVTTVDIDHASYLGDTRDLIGWEKAHVFRGARPAICGDRHPPESLVAHARELGADLWVLGRDFDGCGDRQQWVYTGRETRRSGLAPPALRGADQIQNAATALAALESLASRLPLTQQAVREGLANVHLPGRFQVLPGRPVTVLDVGHNPHAAAHLVRTLQAMSYHPRTWMVFGVLRDKDVDGVIRTLAPVVDHWLLASLPGERGSDARKIARHLESAGIVDGPEHVVTCHESPSRAYRVAQARAAENDRIIVFGSFLTVSDVLASLGRQVRV